MMRVTLWRHDDFPKGGQNVRPVWHGRKRSETQHWPETWLRFAIPTTSIRGGLGGAWHLVPVPDEAVRIRIRETRARILPISFAPQGRQAGFVFRVQRGPAFRRSSARTSGRNYPGGSPKRRGIQAVSCPARKRSRPRSVPPPPLRSAAASLVFCGPWEHRSRSGSHAGRAGPCQARPPTSFQSPPKPHARAARLRRAPGTNPCQTSR